MINLGDGIYILKTKFGYYIIVKWTRKEWQVAFIDSGVPKVLDVLNRWVNGKGIDVGVHVEIVYKSFREIRVECLAGKYQSKEVNRDQLSFIEA